MRDGLDHSHGTRRFVFAAVVLLAAAFDLWSKSEAFTRIGPPDSGRAHDVIPRVLRFETAVNPGMAWSLFSGSDTRWIIASLSMVALPVILAAFFRTKSPTWIFTLALAFIAGGTIGNLYDRIAFGSVRDFIHFHSIQFPIFNAADSFICIGAALFALEQVWKEKPSKVAAPASA